MIGCKLCGWETSTRGKFHICNYCEHDFTLFSVFVRNAYPGIAYKYRVICRYKIFRVNRLTQKNLRAF